jgi:hypothetical protein
MAISFRVSAQIRQRDNEYDGRLFPAQVKLRPCIRLHEGLVNPRLPFMGYPEDHKFSRVDGREGEKADQGPMIEVVIGRLRAFKL